MRLPVCVVCGRKCIPLADYDLPTCPACDLAMERALERAAFAEPFAAFYDFERKIS